MPAKKHWPPGNTARRPPEEEQGFVIADSPYRAANVSHVEGAGRDMSIITFHATAAMIDGMEQMVRAGKYLSRSDGIRAAIRKLLDAEWPRWCGA
jgi:hypothetical protein